MPSPTSKAEWMAGVPAPDCKIDTQATLSLRSQAHMLKRFLLLLPVLALLLQCQSGSLVALKREELFSLSLGKMEDQP